MKAIILSIGDELVLGQTVDTNSAWLSNQLAQIGCPVAAHVTVGDDQKGIEGALTQAAGQCDFLIVSGGLGPTQDDLTRQALAAVLNEPLELNAAWLKRLEEFFRARGRKMSANNRIQAMIPRGSQMIENTAGTAPGIDAVFATANKLCRIFCMPGVPSEMKKMFGRDVLPHLATIANGGVILSRTLHTFGVGESIVGEKLGHLMDRDRNPSVGTTVSGGGVSLRVNARFENAQIAKQELEKTCRQCRQLLGDLVYGEDEQTLQEVVGQLLLGAGAPVRTVSIGESCTGGLLAKMLTDVPGSSRYFQFGWITYSEQAKTQSLGVDPQLLSIHGAVSEPVARAMAEGCRRKSGSDFALSITGIAGPDGGSAEKPVGTVHIALAHPQGTEARAFLFSGDRQTIRRRSAMMALSLLRFHLLGRPASFLL